MNSSLVCIARCSPAIVWLCQDKGMQIASLMYGYAVHRTYRCYIKICTQINCLIRIFVYTNPVCSNHYDKMKLQMFVYS